MLPPRGAGTEVHDGGTDCGSLKGGHGTGALT